MGDKNVEDKIVRVTFDATIPETFMNEFGKIVDHKMDSLLNLSEFPEIKSVYRSWMEVIGDNDLTEIWKNHDSCVVTIKFDEKSKQFGNTNTRYKAFKNLAAIFAANIKHYNYKSRFKYWFDYNKYQIHILNSEDLDEFTDRINDSIIRTLNGDSGDEIDIDIDIIIEYSNRSKFYITFYDEEAVCIPFDHDTIKNINEYESYYEAE